MTISSTLVVAFVQQFGLWAPLITFLGIPVLFAVLLSLLGMPVRKIYEKMEKRERDECERKGEEFHPESYKTAGITIGLFTEVAFGLVYIPTVSYTLVQSIHSYGFSGYWDTVTYWVAQILLLIWVYPGLRKIRPAWRGALTVFGRRIPNVQIAEGINWLPWILWSAIPVNMKEMSLEIGKGEEEKRGHEEEGLVLTSNRVRVLFDLSITYKVFDPYRFTGVGIDMVDTGVHDLSLAQVRYRIAQTSDDGVYNLSEALRQDILHAIDQKSDVWGIFVTKVIIKYILPFSDTVATAYEKRAVEEDERDGESVERQFNLESLKMYQDAGLTPEGAAAMHAGERGKKVPISVDRILVNDEGLNTAAAIIARARGGDNGTS